MAKAYKCDRCQKFKLGYPALEATDSYDTQQTVNPVYDELCNDCKADYLKWRSMSSEDDTDDSGLRG